jgi:hypothetical protein
MKFPFLKEVFSRLGVFISPRMVHYLNGILNYLSVGRWFHDRKIAIPLRCAGRGELYQFVAQQIQEPATYLEFGVLEGATLRQWIKLLKSPATTFTGFDSFEGLPENWGLFTSKEVFDVKGKLPQFDDPRVRLVKGWFNDTLPPFLREFHPHPTLVLHLDADLYSSTIFVLRQMKPHLRPGTILIFDEFFDREHELKALNEFLNDEKLNVRCLAATRALSQVAFQLLPANYAP